MVLDLSNSKKNTKNLENNKKLLKSIENFVQKNFFIIKMIKIKIFLLNK